MKKSLIFYFALLWPVKRGLHRQDLKWYMTWMVEVGAPRVATVSGTEWQNMQKPNSIFKNSFLSFNKDCGKKRKQIKLMIVKMIE